MEGQKFHMLTAVRHAGNYSDGSITWEFRCDCGEVVVVPAYWVENGSKQSCGCLGRRLALEVNTTHGLSRTPEYSSWSSMIDRCYKPKLKSYKNYGGRGITVCDRWRESVAAFVEDMGPRPSRKHEIDRRDNDGNYEPGNCRWVERIVQGGNKRNNHRVEFRGESKTLAEWSRSTGLKMHTIMARLRMGWTPERALTTEAGLNGMKEDSTRVNYHLSFNGQTLTPVEWSRITGIKAHTILGRLRSGWSVEKALTTPTGPNGVKSD